ncbi:hypothetical protein GCM10020221_08470 [Streptomyces thioluteus]|uniref:Uncharacterized protein n=1 Tax=Streptomyces thioluteus TaxID=66431 RepID=A0ABN3WIR4_STRTU
MSTWDSALGRRPRDTSHREGPGEHEDDGEDEGEGSADAAGGLVHAADGSDGVMRPRHLVTRSSDVCFGGRGKSVDARAPGPGEALPGRAGARLTARGARRAARPAGGTAA